MHPLKIAIIAENIRKSYDTTLETPAQKKIPRKNTRQKNLP